MNIDSIFKISIVLYLPSVMFLKLLVSLSPDTYKKRLCDIFTPLWCLWCGILSLFSFMGTFYIGRYILLEYNNKRINDSESLFWYNAFIVSKIPELFDTILIILRSKALVPLQWYHHWCTLLICYIFKNYHCDEFTFFFFMNYFVHSFMYFYFAIYPIFGKSLFLFGTFVNVIQTIQMLIAVFIALYYYFYVTDYSRCLISPIDNFNYLAFGGISMYVTYLLFFIQLFYERNKRIKRD